MSNASVTRSGACSNDTTSSCCGTLLSSTSKSAGPSWRTTRPAIGHQHVQAHDVHGDAERRPAARHGRPWPDGNGAGAQGGRPRLMAAPRPAWPWPQGTDPPLEGRGRPRRDTPTRGRLASRRRLHQALEHRAGSGGVAGRPEQLAERKPRRVGGGKQPRRLFVGARARLPLAERFELAPVQHARVVRHQPILARRPPPRAPARGAASACLPRRPSTWPSRSRASTWRSSAAAPAAADPRTCPSSADADRSCSRSRRARSSPSAACISGAARASWVAPASARISESSRNSSSARETCADLEPAACSWWASDARTSPAPRRRVAGAGRSEQGSATRSSSSRPNSRWPAAPNAPERSSVVHLEHERGSSVSALSDAACRTGRPVAIGDGHSRWSIAARFSNGFAPLIAAMPTTLRLARASVRGAHSAVLVGQRPQLPQLAAGVGHLLRSPRSRDVREEDGDVRVRESG